MTRCVFHVDPEGVPATFPPGEVHVLLYGGKPVHYGTAAIGAQLRDLYKRLGVQPSARAVDLVSIALAVTAADTFVLRANAATSWERDIEIEMPLWAPDVWSPIVPDLERMLAFLSGDRWKFSFRENGEAVPSVRIIRSKRRRLRLSGTDSVSMFSGGLDSTISTISMLERGQFPILVSHAYTGDATVQDRIASKLQGTVQRISVNAWPTSGLASDVSMRTRSFLFIAIGVLVCDAWSAYHRRESPPLIVPENGFIAVNAPLTPRRIGSLSTRTTHPYFLDQFRSLLVSAGLPAAITNPYELNTKGEMVNSLSSNVTFRALVSSTVSCSKWKRSSIQCGRCFPCLVRRAALYTGNIDDKTIYAARDLSITIKGDEEARDDLIALMSAVRRLETRNLERWVSRAGPLPFERVYRSSLVDVFRRGLVESGLFLRDSGLLT